MVQFAVLQYIAQRVQRDHIVLERERDGYYQDRMKVKSNSSPMKHI